MMVTDKDAPGAMTMPQQAPVNVLSSAKEEEGPVKGEFWAVLRALTVLMAVMIVLGLLIA